MIFTMKQYHYIWQHLETIITNDLGISLSDFCRETGGLVHNSYLSGWMLHGTEPGLRFLPVIKEVLDRYGWKPPAGLDGDWTLEQAAARFEEMFERAGEDGIPTVLQICSRCTLKKATCYYWLSGKSTPRLSSLLEFESAWKEIVHEWATAAA